MKNNAWNSLFFIFYSVTLYRNLSFDHLGTTNHKKIQVSAVTLKLLTLYDFRWKMVSGGKNIPSIQLDDAGWEKTVSRKAEIPWLNDILSCPQRSQSENYMTHPEVYQGCWVSIWPQEHFSTYRGSWNGSWYMETQLNDQTLKNDPGTPASHLH